MTSVICLLPLEVFIRVLDRLGSYVEVISYVNRYFHSGYETWIRIRRIPKNKYRNLLPNESLSDGYWRLYKWSQKRGFAVGSLQSAIRSEKVRLVKNLYKDYKRLSLHIPLYLEKHTISLDPPADFILTNYIVDMYLRLGHSPQSLLESTLRDILCQKKYSLLKYYYKCYQDLALPESELFLVDIVVSACRMKFYQALDVLSLQPPLSRSGADIICCDQWFIVQWIHDHLRIHSFYLDDQKGMVQTLIHHDSRNIAEW
jgi:hypothetical protein